MDEQIDQIGQDRPEPSRLNREQGHEFVNIFSIIIANAQLVGETLETTGQVQQQLERIIKACRRGEALVHQIRSSEDHEKKDQEVSLGTEPNQSVISGRILVVDDEVDLIEIIRFYLAKVGYDVQGITDSNLALEMLLADPFRFDLVITDLEMPQLSGAALSRTLHELRPDLPVIIVTGHDRQNFEIPASDSGAGDLLLKPLDRHKLLATVRRLLTS